MALASWQGGFYERLVSMVKKSMKKAVGRKQYSLDQLITLLTEIEAVLNTRPLYKEFNSGFTLTPVSLPDWLSKTWSLPITRWRLL